MSLYDQHQPLPEISFVGGSTQTFNFHAFVRNTHTPMDLLGCTGTFSIASYMNRDGQPLLTKPMVVKLDSDGTGSILSVTLTPQETVGLYGKYLYQLTIKDIEGVVEIPEQGSLYITNNINKDAVR